MPAWATLSGGLHGVALRLESQCAEERESAEARRRSTLISVRGKHNGPFEMMHGVRCTVAAPAAALKVKPQRAHKNFTWNSKPQRKEFYRCNSKSQVQRLQKQNCRSCTLKKIQQQSEAPSQRERCGPASPKCGGGTRHQYVLALYQRATGAISVHETRVPDPDPEEKSNADP